MRNSSGIHCQVLSRGTDLFVFSSVDAHTDALMQRILRTAFADRTIIAIAHRLDTILDFDRVVVMDAGRIVEVGVPGRLLEMEGSLFRALVESQKVG